MCFSGSELENSLQGRQMFPKSLSKQSGCISLGFVTKITIDWRQTLQNYTAL